VPSARASSQAKTIKRSTTVKEVNKATL